MSKLETAFSKAMQEQADKKKQADPQTRSQPHAVHEEPSHVSKDLALQSMVPVSAKHEIKKMPSGEPLSDAELERRGLIHPRMADTHILNVYRNLRTKLLSTQGTKQNFVTLVTPAVEGGGESLVSANLAAAFAFDDSKTALLIEGHVRSGPLSQIFGLGNQSGLIDFLEQDAGEDLSLASILQPTGIPRLRVLPGGSYKENSAESFSSEGMKSVLDELLNRYPERYPIINAPSVNESAEARILLDLCDQVLLVVPYGKCSQDDIKRAAQVIGKNKFAGVVLDEF